MIGWCVRRPAVIWAACLALLVAGGVSFSRLALATRTEVELPQLAVSASWPGAAAELVEMYITSPLEGAVQGVRGVRRVNSDSRDNGASIRVMLDPKAHVQLTRLAILERIEILYPELPPTATRPTVSNYVPENLQEEILMIVTADGPYTPGTMQQQLEDVVQPRLEAVPGVAGVRLNSATEMGVSLIYDPQFLRQIGMPPEFLSQAMNDASIARSVGDERLGASIRPVIVRDQAKTIDDVASLPVRSPSGRMFRLGDLASVVMDEDSRGRYYRIDGKSAVTLYITREPRSDAIRTAEALHEAIREVEPSLLAGTRLRIVQDQSEGLARELSDLTRRGALAFLAVLVVLTLLVRDVRGVALVMGSTAVAIAGTALSLFILKIPANLLTLAGLGMGVGILVQNALVVTDRLRTAPATPEGRTRIGRRIAPAVLGATLTTAVVLFPFLYLQGDARAAFVPFAAAFVLALFWSVLTALTVVPALAGRHEFRRRRWRWVERIYSRSLGWTLRLRWLTLLLTAVSLVAVSWIFVKKVPRFAWGGGFGTQRTTIGVYLGFPRGSDPDVADAAMRAFEQIVLGRPEVERVETNVGGTGGNMTVVFTDESQFTAAPLEIEELLTQRAVFIGGANISVRGQGPGFSASGGGSSISSTFRLRILGYSFSGVEQVALSLKERLELINRVHSVNIASASQFIQQRGFTVTLEPDRNALARYGVTAQQFSSAVQRELRGASAVTRIPIGGDELPVRLKARGDQFRSLEELRDALVPNQASSPVRVADLAAVGEREALSQITREDQQYMRTLSYDFRGPARLAQRTHDAFMKTISVPAGYSVQESGYGFGVLDRSERGLWLVFGIGIALVVLAVALVFDSVWAAALVFLSLPIALGGVMAAFWLFKAAFTREAAVGVILVIGLAVNQAILLVDAALATRVRHRDAGLRKGLDAGAVTRAAVDRAGMIMLVTFAALASLMPLAINTRTTDLFGAIALATAGGTVAGTLGSLFVMPAMIFGRRGTRRKRRPPFRWLRRLKFWGRKPEVGAALPPSAPGVA
jgi:multidrug efflux pump subunit AcrB